MRVRLPPYPLLSLSTWLRSICPPIYVSFGVILQRQNPTFALVGIGVRVPVTPPGFLRASSNGQDGRTSTLPRCEVRLPLLALESIPGVDPGAALNTEGTFNGCGVRLLCSPRPPLPLPFLVATSLDCESARGRACFENSAHLGRGVWGSRPPLSATLFSRRGPRKGEPVL